MATDNRRKLGRLEGWCGGWSGIWVRVGIQTKGVEQDIPYGPSGPHALAKPMSFCTNVTRPFFILVFAGSWLLFLDHLGHNSVIFPISHTYTHLTVTRWNPQSSLSTFQRFICPSPGIECSHESRFLPTFVLHVGVRVEICGLALRGRSVGPQKVYFAGLGGGSPYL